MSLFRRGMLDAPVDYRQLWQLLAGRIEELAAKQATDAVMAEDELLIRRCQGAYAFAQTALSEMVRLLEEARKSNGPLRQAADDS